jgi:nitroreductase
MAELSVTEAVLQRGAVRQYEATPVSRDLISEILELAVQAPSGGNVQPCKVYALTGDEKSRLSEAVIARAAESPSGDRPDIPIYPDKMPEPWRSRRFQCGELMYSAIGIGREDKTARFEQGARNMFFFDAPVGLIITMSRGLCESQMIDVGIFVQTLLLLSQERGLASCPQASWTMWSGVVRETLAIDDDEMVMLGISLGYAVADAPINHLKQPRIALNEFSELRGFE